MRPRRLARSIGAQRVEPLGGGVQEQRLAGMLKVLQLPIAIVAYRVRPGREVGGRLPQVNGAEAQQQLLK